VQLVITGEDAAGRSKVERVVAVPSSTHEPKARDVVEIWRMASLPPELPFDRQRSVDVAEMDIGVPVGSARTQYMQVGAGFESVRHRTHTLDVVVVISGSIELVLDDAAVQLVPGDTLVMPGITHHWRPGPDGCGLVVTSYGLAAP
jgi:mannose-6-phosphate isomerase-like protein (cupin superfamily)